MEVQEVAHPIEEVLFPLLLEGGQHNFQLMDMEMVVVVIIIIHLVKVVEVVVAQVVLRTGFQV